MTTIGPPARRRIYPDTGQLALRALIVVGTLSTIIAAIAAGTRAPGSVQAVLVVLSVVTAWRPESFSGVVMLIGSAYVWALSPETLSVWVLLAVAGMLLAHVAALVVAQGPARMRLDASQLRRWALRGLLVWCAAAAVWGLGVLMRDLPDRRLVYAVGLVLVVLVTVVAIGLLTARLDSYRRGPD